MKIYANETGDSEMRNLVCRYWQDESGAVTVDWVVLTAAIVGLGIAVIATIAGGATNTSTSLGANLQAGNVSSLNADIY